MTRRPTWDDTDALGQIDTLITTLVAEPPGELAREGWEGPMSWSRTGLVGGQPPSCELCRADPGGYFHLCAFVQWMEDQEPGAEMTRLQLELYAD